MCAVTQLINDVIQSYDDRAKNCHQSAAEVPDELP